MVTGDEDRARRRADRPAEQRPALELLLARPRARCRTSPSRSATATLADALLEPTVIYVRAVLELLRSGDPASTASRTSPAAALLNLLRLNEAAGFAIEDPLPGAADHRARQASAAACPTPRRGRSSTWAAASSPSCPRRARGRGRRALLAAHHPGTRRIGTVTRPPGRLSAPGVSGDRDGPERGLRYSSGQGSSASRVARLAGRARHAVVALLAPPSPRARRRCRRRPASDCCCMSSASRSSRSASPRARSSPRCYPSRSSGQPRPRSAHARRASRAGRRASRRAARAPPPRSAARPPRAPAALGALALRPRRSAAPPSWDRGIAARELTPGGRSPRRSRRCGTPAWRAAQRRRAAHSAARRDPSLGGVCVAPSPPASDAGCPSGRQDEPAYSDQAQSP